MSVQCFVQGAEFSYTLGTWPNNTHTFEASNSARVHRNLRLCIVSFKDYSNLVVRHALAVQAFLADGAHCSYFKLTAVTGHTAHANVRQSVNSARLQSGKTAVEWNCQVTTLRGDVQ